MAPDFRTLFESAPGLYLVLTPELTIVAASDAYLRATRTKREEILGRGLFDVFPDNPDDPTASGVSHTRASMNRVRETRASDTMPIQRHDIQRPESQGGGFEKKFWSPVNSPVLDPAGEIVWIIHRVEDMTDSMRIEQELDGEKQSLSELRMMVESVRDYAILMLDAEGRVTSWNEGARRIKGYEAQEIIGRSFSCFYPAEDVVIGKPEAELVVAAREGRIEDEGWRVRKDGSRFWANVVITALRDQGGNLRGFCKVTRDFTEREEHYQRIREASRLKSEFLANMSHELRTPLNAIIGFSELIHDGKAGAVTPDQKEYLGDILTSSRHLLQLINDVLDLSKVESGKMEFRPQPVNLVKLTAEVGDILRTLAAKKRIFIRTEIEAGLSDIVIDPSKLKQLLYNYLSNALKFTPDEGRVELRALAEGEDFFRVEVEDSGIGIAPGDIPKLFVEFQQLDASASKKYPGTGLGLALTKRIVEAQGGRVGVESRPGEGSVFFAVLPRISAASPQAETVDPTFPLDVASAPRVLVIEDESSERAWILRTFAAAGYRVEGAATGLEAIERCAQISFDAITLDLLLPDVSGREVLRAIRSGGANAETAVIIVSVVAQRGVAAGFHVSDLLSKPVEAEHLVAALRRAGVTPGEKTPIFVVDDDTPTLRLAQTVLKAWGCDAVCFEHGEEALIAAAHEPPKAVVLDLFMSGVDGLEFLHRLRKIPSCQGTPVIVWTSKSLTVAETARIRRSAQAVVSKNDGTSALIEELKALVPLRKPAEARHGR